MNTASLFRLFLGVALGLAWASTLRSTARAAETPAASAPSGDLAEEAGKLAGETIARLDELIARPDQPPLFRRHLQSVRTVVFSERGRIALYTADPQLLRDTVQQLRSLNRGFHADAAEWPTYLNGRRPLILTFLSARDNTVQFYKLGLPRDWVPARPYPLFLELHGGGPRVEPMGFVSDQLGLPDTPDIPAVAKTYEDVDRGGYHLYPWGRGNSGYVGIGETDIWEALADAGKTFHFDPERRYLYGFSMGGGGTWHLAARTPDQWAAISLISPSLGRPPADAPARFDDELARNLAHMPVWIWCGEKDSLYPQYQQIVASLRRVGADVTASTAPDVGHALVWEVQQAQVLWLKRHVRQRPERFGFLADSDDHLGAWGVELVRDVTLSAVPRFTCEVKGQTVILESTGTHQLKIDTGASGLGLAGDVTVIWNGRIAYHGAVGRISLGADGPLSRAGL